MRRRYLATVGVAILTIGVTAGSVLAAPAQTTQRIFRLNNPHSHGDQNLAILEFLANGRVKDGRTISIPAENVFGVEGLQHADLIVELQLSCDPVPEFGPERLAASRIYYIVRSSQGFGEIRVKANKFRVRTAAFDGVSNQGQLTFSGTFSHHGTSVAGSIAADVPQLTNEGITLSNCQTDPGGKPAKLGKPLRFHILATG